MKKLFFQKACINVMHIITFSKLVSKRFSPRCISVLKKGSPKAPRLCLRRSPDHGTVDVVGIVGVVLVVVVMTTFTFNFFEIEKYLLNKSSRKH